MKIYRHTQIGWLVLVLLGIGILLTGYFGFLYLNWTALSVFGVFVICIILFASLSVIVNDKSIEIRFGVGLIKKKFNLGEIELCTVVRNCWWYGWGIRKIPKGWLFNVSGLDAVELTMRNGKVYRIGTDEPQKLGKFIQGNLNEEK
ncbi:MAG: hypothetical protein K8S14_00510 [Actinomycetia bacterium]|nr:hypothetical protein [Actinomycetes bacterium]